MSNDPSLVFSGSHASTKDWSLPDDLAMELSDIKHESVEHILDRYGMQEKPVAVHDAKNAQKAPESAFMTALLREANSKADSRTANNAPAYSTTSNSLVE